jgi:antitoxin VapB
MADALHIDDPKAVALARELAERTGESVSDAVVHALEERLLRNATPEKAELAARTEKVLQIIEEMRKLPILDPRSPDELVGYDKDGLPR